MLYISKYLNKTLGGLMLALFCIAATLVPLHPRLQKWATLKLVERNKKIRLAAAKKTIESLDKKPTRTDFHSGGDAAQK